MYEQNNTPPPDSSAAQQDAIDINDFVFAATGARLRRLTLPDGEHWFVAADAATQLGYANTRQALLAHVAADCTRSLAELAQGVCTADALRKLAAHRLQKSMKLVNLKGLVRLVNGCTKPACEPFKAWVSEVIQTVQQQGSYSLEPAPGRPAPGRPAPAGGTAYVMPEQVVEAIVRLEERNLWADELLASAAGERNDLLRQITDSQNRMADALRDIAEALRQPGRSSPAPELTAQQLLDTWKKRHLLVTDDVHTVAAVLAPALTRGEARYRVDEIAARTGMSQDRVHDCLRMLLKRGCMRQTGCSTDGAPVYVLP
ncbi:Bro-N domain-containing protein [Streptomyces sp. Root1310]|uniref:BRO-N domain-containing protein n=1 Tax=Streptomyces sp. Root1310 TaxID=1736452 RepID=UPI00070A9A18|nr:Bro-N domain-containing protein [Streptomyces sp. Root1310]KQX62317.1 DNA-binding protein [Streptomyces sp. Root1310]